jgi:hypothetical protein
MLDVIACIDCSPSMSVSLSLSLSLFLCRNGSDTPAGKEKADSRCCSGGHTQGSRRGVPACATLGSTAQTGCAIATQASSGEPQSAPQGCRRCASATLCSTAQTGCAIATQASSGDHERQPPDAAGVPAVYSASVETCALSSSSPSLPLHRQSDDRPLD